MTTIPQPKLPGSSYSLKYDAWNRLVEVSNASGVVQTNEFDGLNRRIVKTDTKGTVSPSDDDTYDYYYNQAWQVLEIRKNGASNPWKQYAYHPYYADANAVCFYDANTDGADIDEHYYLQDANFNVTAVVDDSGTVLERYDYTPYGEVTYLDANFYELATQESDIANELLYTGRRLDPETGLQLNRNRFYHQQLGRWVSRDPIGYRAGNTSNLYEYVASMPLKYTDPLGLTPPFMYGPHYDPGYDKNPPPPRYPIDDLPGLFPDSDRDDLDELSDKLKEIQDDIKSCGGTVSFYWPGQSADNGDGCRCKEADEKAEDGFRGFKSDWDYEHQEHDGWGWQVGDGDHNWGEITGPDGEEFYLDFWLNDDNPISLGPPR